MPLRCKDEGMTAYDSFIKILPLQKEQEPILVKYAVLYNRSETMQKAMAFKISTKIELEACC